MPFARIDIVALLGASIATGYAFSRVSRTAALLLPPYVLWVGCAAALDVAIRRSNA